MPIRYAERIRSLEQAPGAVERYWSKIDVPMHLFNFLHLMAHSRTSAPSLGATCAQNPNHGHGVRCLTGSRCRIWWRSIRCMVNPSGPSAGQTSSPSRRWRTRQESGTGRLPQTAASWLRRPYTRPTENFFFPHHLFETNLGSSERAAAFSMACLCCAPTHVEQLDQVPLGTYWIRCML